MATSWKLCNHKHNHHHLHLDLVLTGTLHFHLQLPTIDTTVSVTVSEVAEEDEDEPLEEGLTQPQINRLNLFGDRLVCRIQREGILGPGGTSAIQQVSLG